MYDLVTWVEGEEMSKKKEVKRQYLVEVEPKPAKAKDSVRGVIDGGVRVFIDAKNRTEAKKAALKKCNGFLGIQFRVIAASECDE